MKMTSWSQEKQMCLFFIYMDDSLHLGDMQRLIKTGAKTGKEPMCVEGGSSAALYQGQEG